MESSFLTTLDVPPPTSPPLTNQYKIDGSPFPRRDCPWDGRKLLRQTSNFSSATQVPIFRLFKYSSREIFLLRIANRHPGGGPPPSPSTMRSSGDALGYMCNQIISSFSLPFTPVLLLLHVCTDRKVGRRVPGARKGLAGARLFR